MPRPGIVLLLVLALACAAAAAKVEAPHVSVELVAERSALVPGQRSWVGLKFAIEPGWHLYWKNSGDSGEPPQVKWTAPPGVSMGAIAWPRPGRHELPPLMNYGYGGELLLPVPVDVQPGTAGLVKLIGDVTWLVCQEECIPGKAKLELELPVAATAAAAAGSPAFEKARAQAPRALPAGSAHALRRGAALVLKVAPLAETGAAYFFPEAGDLLAHAAPQRAERRDGGLELTLPLQENVGKLPAELRGVLEVGAAAFEVAAPLAAGPAASAAPAPATVAVVAPAAPPPDPGAPGGLIEALLLAFLGGIVLNVMPCVFPVLSIKALEVVQQAESRGAEIRRNALLYAAGVVVSFWALAGVLLALRAGGEKLGWGFHLQSPGFGALLCGLLFLMALSLLGVFEVEPPAMDGQRRSGALGAFLTGVLATVVATPCTAPFMGTALGWAATQPAVVALAVFTALGAGLAAPYVGISWVPAVGRWLPRPGRWMETVKQVLAFPLFATVVWLTWVVGLQTDMDTVALLLAGYLALSVAAWMHGRWNDRRVRRVATALALATLALMAVRVKAPPAEAARAPEGAAAADGKWVPWSPELVEQLRAAGRPAFVDFTAAWCVTCKVNELTALTGSVMARMAELGIVAVKADWTRRDAKIAAALARFGRDGVPLYVVYPRVGEPWILPQVLTQSGVLAELERAARKTGGTR